MIPFHFYHLLARFRLPGGQGDGGLGAGRDAGGFLGGRDRLQLPGSRRLGPAGGREAGRRLLAVGAFIAVGAHAEVAPAVAAAVAMVTRVAGTRIRHNLKGDHKRVNYPLVRKAVPGLEDELGVSQLLFRWER